MLDLRLKSEVFDYQWYQNITATGPGGHMAVGCKPCLAFHHARHT